MAEVSDLIGYIKGKLYQYVAYTRAGDFESFFKDALFFSPTDAQLLAYSYLAACDVFGVSPGLGQPKANARTRATPVDLQGEFTKLGLGKFSSGLITVNFEMKLSEYLGGHTSTASAKRVLTPAKRDALRNEAGKFLKVSAGAWHRYYDEPKSYSVTGVRG